MIQEIIRNVQREMEACYEESMIQKIIYDFTGKIEIRCTEIMSEFEKTLDFSVLEQALSDLCADFTAEILQVILNNMLTNVFLLISMKKYAAKCGMKFKEYRKVTVTLGNGRNIRITSPYFIKSAPKSGARRKKRPNGSAAHIGLDIFGFMGHKSPVLLRDSAQMAILCPSFEIARTILKGRGIRLDVKTIRRICRLAGERGLPFRGGISLNGNENLKGYTLVIGIDGGRLRERKRKRGRKAGNLKRKGYNADWKEPKLFTIYLIDAKGDIVKKFKPLHDATMEKADGMFELLGRYLRSLNINDVERVVFCGDGGSWIWNGVEKLLKKFKIDDEKVFQVLDYTHARQNLQEIIDLAAPGKQASFAGKAEYLLWNGRIDALKKSIEETITDKSKRKQAIEKLNNYFISNEKRMQYVKFKREGLPCGSGQVESAIRRVINLRLKAPGTFWTKDMAECFLFLRSQLISGRWEIFMGNLTSLVRRAFRPFYGVAPDTGIAPATA